MSISYEGEHEKVSAPTTPGQAEGCVDVSLQSHASPAPPQTDQAEGAREEEKMSPSSSSVQNRQEQGEGGSLNAL